MSPSRQENGDQEANTGRRTRAPYIQRACIECKRRKQRCSGHEPCRNCESRSVQCNYGICDSSHYDGGNDCLKTVTRLITQSQVQSLNHLVESMQVEIQYLKEATPIDQIAEERVAKKRKLRPPATLAVSPPPEQAPHYYQGLTSAEYSLKLTSLELAQLQDPTSTRSSNLDACFDRGEGNAANKGPQTGIQVSHGDHSRLEHVSVQVFTEISHSRARELVVLYSEAVGSLHPVVDIAVVLDCADGLYAQLKERGKNSSRLTGRYDVIVIRLILAIALLSEQNQSAKLIENCYEGVEHELNRILCSETVSLRGVTLVLLGALYHLFSNRVRMAWRLCGISASLAMELGLHRPETLQRAFPNESERSKAVRVMWSIFVLDHGWSAALGLPRNMDDAALDSTHIVPQNSPYLRAMASYCAISTKIVSATSKMPVSTQVYEEEQFQFLNYQIDRWQQSVLESLVGSPELHIIAREPPESVKTLLYLRANQMRILLLRPLFFSESVVKPDQEKVSESLQIAIRTISAIRDLNATTESYRKQHPFFSHFLTSATSLILLIITYHGHPDNASEGPRMCLTQDVCNPLKEALDLSSAYSSSSNSSAQLHRRLLSILGLLSRLGILSLDLETQDPQAQVPSSCTLQKSFDSPAVPYTPEPADLVPLIYTSPPLTSVRTGFQQQESMPDLVPFYQDDNQQMDVFLNGTIWNELDKLLTSCLNSVEPPLNQTNVVRGEYMMTEDGSL